MIYKFRLILYFIFFWCKNIQKNRNAKVKCTFLFIIRRKLERFRKKVPLSLFQHNWYYVMFVLKQTKEKAVWGWGHNVVKNQKWTWKARKKRKILSICVSFSRKNRGKKRFIIKHENIIFQDMLLSPPNRRLRMGKLS